jgi:hypothetical protein
MSVLLLRKCQADLDRDGGATHGRDTLTSGRFTGHAICGQLRRTSESEDRAAADTGKRRGIIARAAERDDGAHAAPASMRGAVREVHAVASITVVPTSRPVMARII